MMLLWAFISVNLSMFMLVLAVDYTSRQREQGNDIRAVVGFSAGCATTLVVITSSIYFVERLLSWLLQRIL